MQVDSPVKHGAGWPETAAGRVPWRRHGASRAQSAVWWTEGRFPDRHRDADDHEYLAL